MDYNWLLTTIAQSSAALVGISSGFLILRISMYINEKNNLLSQLTDIKISYINQRHFDPTKDPLYKEKENKLEKKTFPKRIFIGLIGIVWLMGFSIYYPVSLIPQDSLIGHFTWDFNTICFLKITFFIGLFILFVYLIWEIIYVAFFQFRIKKESKKTQTHRKTNTTDLV